MWNSFKQTIWQWRGVLIATPSVAVLVILLRLTGMLQPWEGAALDYYGQLRPVESRAIRQRMSPPVDRPPLPPQSDVWEGLWITGWAGLGAGLIWQPRSTRRRPLALGATADSASGRWRSVRIFLSLNLAGAGLVAVTYGAGLASWWLPVVPAFLSLSGAAIAVMAYQTQTATALRNILGRHIPDAMVAGLLATPTGLTLTGERRQVTTLIASIRGFTRIAEHFAPEQVVTLLNLYLRETTQVIQRYGGIINDRMGDGLVVCFGAPLSQEHDVEQAVTCAVAMQLAMYAVNQQSQALGLPPLEMGIGINTGEVVVGNLGAQKHGKYTVIGNHVDIAARIESFTVGGQILIAESTFEAVRTMVRIDGQMQSYIQSYMKGLAMPISLYEVSGMGGDYRLFLPEDHHAFIALKREMPVLYSLLEEEEVGDLEFEGMMVQLSAKGAEIQSSYLPRALSNVQLTLVLHPATKPAHDGRSLGGNDDDEPEYLTNVCAQVLARRVVDGTGFFVRFTSLPPRAAEYLQMTRSDRRARR